MYLWKVRYFLLYASNLKHFKLAWVVCWELTQPYFTLDYLLNKEKKKSMCDTVLIFLPVYIHYIHLCKCCFLFLYYENLVQEDLRWCIRWLPGDNPLCWLLTNIPAGLDLFYFQCCESWECEWEKACQDEWLETYYGQQLRWSHLSGQLSREVVVLSYQLGYLIWMGYRTDILYFWFFQVKYKTLFCSLLHTSGCC